MLQLYIANDRFWGKTAAKKWISLLHHDIYHSCATRYFSYHQLRHLDQGSMYLYFDGLGMYKQVRKTRPTVTIISIFQTIFPHFKGQFSNFPIFQPFLCLFLFNKYFKSNVMALKSLSMAPTSVQNSQKWYNFFQIWGYFRPFQHHLSSLQLK
jgi:hypothetical protein